MSKISAFINKYKYCDERSKLALNNIAGSFVCKIISVVVNLLLIPISIDYLNSNQYGIWITISSVIMWLAYFDIGLTQGFRNRFAEAKAKGDKLMCKTLVSTTYILMFLIFGGVFIFLSLIIPLFDWNNILEVDISNDSLTRLLLILAFFFCLKFILSVLTSMCAADQRNSYSATIDAIGQIIILAIICVLSKANNEDNLILFALITGGIPCIVLLFSSIVLFVVRYKDYIPNYKNVKFGITRNIVGLGSKIFIIQITNVLLFQLANILILKYCGGEEVTKYNVANKYFGVLSMLFGIIITPFWSAFTDAQAKQNYLWIKQTYYRINKTYYLFCIFSLIMLLFSPIIYKIWVSNAGDISLVTSVLMCCYILCLIRSMLFANILNGLNLVNIQMRCNIALCILITPSLIICARIYGSYGVLINLIAACFIQSVICRYGFLHYLNKI